MRFDWCDRCAKEHGTAPMLRIPADDDPCVVLSWMEGTGYRVKKKVCRCSWKGGEVPGQFRKDVGDVLVFTSLMMIAFPFLKATADCDYYCEYIVCEENDEQQSD